MQKPNIFILIHKGLRAMLYELSLELQQTDFTIAAETENICLKVKEAIILFEEHADKEDRFILPAIAANEPSVVATFESEHDMDAVLGREILDTVQVVSNSKTSKECIEAGNLLTHTFLRFMVFNIEHMAKEEQVLHTILCRYYDEKELRAIQTNIVQATPAQYLPLFSKWMLKGMNNQEIVLWLSTMAANYETSVYEQLVALAKEVLPANRFQTIQYLNSISAVA